jgi:hypothetical protein
VTVGAPIRLSVYVSFTARFQASRVVVATDVYYHGKIVYRAGSSEDRSGAGRLWDHWSFTPRQPGTYVLVARVRAGTHREVASATFGAVTKTRGLTFTFVRLETQDEKGHPSRIFARTERVFLVATITMRNAPRPVRVEVGQTLQYLTTSRRDATQRVPAGYWRQLGQRVESWFVTGNGTHPYTISFVPQTPYSALRMVVDVTISSRTQRRAAVFEVHG